MTPLTVVLALPAHIDLLALEDLQLTPEEVEKMSPPAPLSPPPAPWPVVVVAMVVVPPPPAPVVELEPPHA